MKGVISKCRIRKDVERSGGGQILRYYLSISSLLSKRYRVSFPGVKRVRETRKHYGNNKEVNNDKF
jgi:RNA 3'-terminal phosphate cyclase